MAVVKAFKRHDVVLIPLDPAVGAEIKKTRPCVIVSPDEMNVGLRTVLVAPMTTVMRGYPSRVRVRFRGKDGEVALDQLRAVDKARVVKRLGALPAAAGEAISSVLVEMFAV
ncbi:MAG: type II toxin-antitoxin system PemK/MazF family toxin [Rhodospirillaceae bacterium]|nr:type II toxin-antitoxin system PemK/MazF family toxin [Rhodospirillaceae bacterium]